MKKLMAATELNFCQHCYGFCHYQSASYTEYSLVNSVCSFVNIAVTVAIFEIIEILIFVVNKSVCNANNTFWIHKARGSPLEVFLGKGVQKICSKFTGENPCRSVISKKLLSNFIEITPRHECSPVNLLNIFRTPFYKNTSGGVLLTKHEYTESMSIPNVLIDLEFCHEYFLGQAT